MLQDLWNFGVQKLKFDPNAFAYELAQGIIGDLYPVPDRMLRHCERIVHEFLDKEMCDSRPPAGKFDLFAVEGGTAAMCYIFDTLMQNGLLHRGDGIALAVPTFTPYIEIAHMDRFAFKVVDVDASLECRENGIHTWQYSDAEIDKLKDKRIKAFFLVNPSNPPSFAMRRSSMQRLVKLVKTKRPDLIIITDDVYGTFVPGFVRAWLNCRRTPSGSIPIPNISAALAGVWAWWPFTRATFSTRLLRSSPPKSAPLKPPVRPHHARTREGEVY